MTFAEANKIFEIWSQWYWPTHIILHSIFLNKIPKSFLPYPLEILEEALNIIAKHYHKNGNHKMSNNIRETLASLIAYVSDEDALQSASENFTNPIIKKLSLDLISNFKKDWKNWIDKQN